MSCMVGIVPLWRTFSRCLLFVDIDKQGHKYGTLIVGIKIKPKKYLRLQRVTKIVSLFSQTIDWFSGAIMHCPNRAHRTGWTENRNEHINKKKENRRYHPWKSETIAAMSVPS
jgi:hypothetical protein